MGTRAVSIGCTAPAAITRIQSRSVANTVVAVQGWTKSRSVLNC